MSNTRESQFSERSIIDKNENVGIGRKQIAKRSPARNHFTTVSTEHGLKSRCNHCNEDLSGIPTSGTSHLIRHLEKKHKEIYSRSVSSEVESSIRNSFDQETSRKLFVKLVSNGDLSFQILESPLFQEWIQSLQPMCTHVNLAEAQQSLLCYFHDECSKLQFELKKLVIVNLSCHTWISNRFKYLSFTAHFIDDSFEVNKRMIGFKQLPLEYGIIHLKSAVNKCFNYLGIDNEWVSKNDKWLTCTSDEHMNNVIRTAFHPLASKRINFIKCCSELLNNLVNSCMAMIKDAIISIRRIITSSHLACGDNQIFLHVPVDNVTRWDSTYHMLRAAHEHRSDLKEYADKHLAKEYHDFLVLSDDDWSRVDSVVKYMETFYNSMVVFSNKNTTANLYLEELWEIRDALHKGSLASDEKLKELSVKMQGEFQKYIDSVFRFKLLAASILDPRRNTVFFEMCCLDLYGKEESTYWVQKIIKNLHALYNFFVNLTKNHVINNSEEAGSSIKTPHETSVGKRFSEFKRQKPNHATTSELERYLNEPVLDISGNFDVLYWWKSNENRYPVLSRIARHLLSTQILGLPSQSAFYMDRNIVDYVDDSKLSPEMVEAIMCCKQWNQTACNNGYTDTSLRVLSPLSVDD